MSINWHHASVIKNKLQKGNFKNLKRAMYYPKNPNGKQEDLKTFTAFMADERARHQTGRAWKAEELRLKCHEDLHKLWYVLLIEKNKLKSDQLMSLQMGQVFYGPSHLQKVRLSMARLLTVVNERKKIRNEYRAMLEDQYIRSQKKAEKKAYVADIEARRERGE